MPPECRPRRRPHPEAARLLVQGLDHGDRPRRVQGAEGDPAPGDDAISQWTSVVTGPEELTWLAEAVAMNSVGSEDIGEDLD